MLYRVHPDGTSDWLGAFGSRLLRDAENHPTADFDKLDWQPSERVFAADGIRLALRYGRPSRRGIIIGGEDLDPLDARERLRESRAETRAGEHMRRKVAEALEPVDPGRLAREGELMAAAESSVNAALAKFDAMLAAALTTAPRSDLIEHWRRVGGVVPDPP